MGDSASIISAIADRLEGEGYDVKTGWSSGLACVGEIYKTGLDGPHRGYAPLVGTIMIGPVPGYLIFHPLHWRELGWNDQKIDLELQDPNMFDRFTEILERCLALVDT